MKLKTIVHLDFYHKKVYFRVGDISIEMVGGTFRLTHGEMYEFL